MLAVIAYDTPMNKLLQLYAEKFNQKVCCFSCVDAFAEAIEKQAITMVLFNLNEYNNQQLKILIKVKEKHPCFSLMVYSEAKHSVCVAEALLKYGVSSIKRFPELFPLLQSKAVGIRRLPEYGEVISLARRKKQFDMKEQFSEYA